MTCTFKKKTYPPIIFTSTRLESVSDHKHLGLNLSSSLSWAPHMNNILNSVSAMCSIMKKLKYNID